MGAIKLPTQKPNVNLDKYALIAYNNLYKYALSEYFKGLAHETRSF